MTFSGLFLSNWRQKRSERNFGSDLFYVVNKFTYDNAVTTCNVAEK